MRKAGEQVRQQSKRKKSVKACKRATGPLESEQSSAAVLRLFPHHAAFGEGRAAPGKAPGKHLAATLTTRRAHRRIEMRAVRARCWPATNNQDGPSRTETNAPCCLALPIAPTLWLIHHAIPLPSYKNTQKYAETCKRDPFPCRRNLLRPRQRPEPISTTAASQSMKTASHSKLVTPLSRAVEFHIGRVLVSHR